MKFLFTFFYCIIFSYVLQAQSFSLDWLFQPGLRLSTLYTPSLSSQDSAYFGKVQSQLALILPLGGKANLDLKKLNIQARQTFLNIGAGLRLPQTNLTENQEFITNFSIGITHLKAGLRNGIWLYNATAGGVQTVNLWEELNPFALVAVAKIKLKGLRKQDIYGLGVGYFNKQVLPIPIFGLNRKLSKSWDIRFLFPVNLTFANRISRKTSLDLRLNTNLFQTQIFSSLNQNSVQWQYRQLQLNVVGKFKLNKTLRLFTEVGLAAGRSLQIKSMGGKERFNFSPTPYLGVSMYFNLGKQLLGSELFENGL